MSFLTLFGVKIAYFRVFWAFKEEKCPWGTTKVKLYWLCGALGSVKAFSFLFHASLRPFWPTNEIPNLGCFCPWGEKFLPYWEILPLGDRQGKILHEIMIRLGLIRIFHFMGRRGQWDPTHFLTLSHIRVPNDYCHYQHFTLSYECLTYFQNFGQTWVSSHSTYARSTGFMILQHFYYSYC